MSPSPAGVVAEFLEVSGLTVSIVFAGQEVSGCGCGVELDEFVTIVFSFAH